MTVEGPGIQKPELESGEHLVESRAELSLLIAYQRYPGRWSKRTLIAATRIPNIFEHITPVDAEEVLDKLETLCAGTAKRA